jgi:protein ImuB
LVAFTDREGNAVRVTALSPEARRAGLTAGLTLADARARVPELVAIERDHGAEARLLARVVVQGGRYTPMVAAEPPDGVVLDIQGCTHPFGGERGLARDLVRRITAQGIACRLGAGDTPEAARARSRFADSPGGDLKVLPVEALEHSREVTVALRRAGLKTIGDLACRPRAMLAARFGDLALRLTRLLGEEDRRITPERPLPPVFALRNFAEPIARTEHALAVLEELLREVRVTLLERHDGGRRFVVRLFRSDGAVPGLAIETGRPVRDPALVMRLFRERLEALADPIDSGFGFDCVRLDVGAIEPLAPRQDGLEGEDGDTEPLAELIDRLAARLGAENVQRIAPVDSHIPECAARLVGPQAGVKWEVATEGEPPLRPLTLLDPPHRVEVLHGLPEGPPRRFTWKAHVHDVAHWDGPERIGAEWWRRSDGAGLTRDYYRVEDGAGHRFWLFRHGLASERLHPDWYLHGLFA